MGDVGECVGWCSGGRFGNQVANFAHALYQAEVCCEPCVWTNPGQLKWLNGDILNMPVNYSVGTQECDASSGQKQKQCKEVKATRKRLGNIWPLFPPWDLAKKLLSKHLVPLLLREPKPAFGV